MGWLTKTLKAVLVSVVFFSATAVWVIVSFSRDSRPLGVSVAIPPLILDAKQPTQSAADQRAGRDPVADFDDRVDSPDPALSSFGNPEEVKPGGFESLVPEITRPILRPESVTPSSVTPSSEVPAKTPPSGAPKQTPKTLLMDSVHHPDQEGLVQVLPPSNSAGSAGSPLKTQSVENQLIPQIGSQTAPPWLRHAVPLSPDGINQPVIAIVIDDLGLNHRALEQVLTLPGPLTVSFLPYAGDLPAQTAAARDAGHEIMVHVPMQPLDSSHDPGPNVLAGTMSEDDLLARLDWALSRFDGYVGINNHMGSAFTSDPHGMGVVMSSLAGRGLLFLDSVTSSDTLGPEMARSFGVPYAERHIFLDHQRTSEAINGQLNALEERARRHGYAVGIGHPHHTTIAALARWLPTLRQKGIALASVAHVVMRQQAEGVIQSAVASEVSAFH